MFTESLVTKFAKEKVEHCSKKHYAMTVRISVLLSGQCAKLPSTSSNVMALKRKPREEE
jgi:hypothetical protein